jgi:ankyrin repeat protein
VEYLITNGASPLIFDVAQHNTCLHWAAFFTRSECIHRLLGSRAIYQLQSGTIVAVADIPCYDEDGVHRVKFVDRRNGWGLTALHLAVYKGSISTGEQQVGEEQVNSTGQEH